MDAVPARNLVFLLDVSGSMAPPERLPLVRTAMRMLVDTLTARDRIAIVVYAGASGVVLPPTSGAHKEPIHAAIARLEAGRVDQRRGRHHARLSGRAGELRQGRHQPRDPRDRRRLQCRRHEPGRSHAAHRREARDRRLPVRARRRHRQPQGLDDGEARRQGQRQLRLPRFAARGAQGARATKPAPRSSPSRRT